MNPVATAKEVTIKAVVIRADGTKKDLGVISHWRAPDQEKKEDKR